MFRNQKMMEGGFCDCDIRVASSGGSGVWGVSEVPLKVNIVRKCQDLDLFF